MLTDYDKKLRRGVNKIKKGIKELEHLGLRTAIDKDVETMFGSLVDNIYITDRANGKIILQKHLFTVERRKYNVNE